MTHEIDPLDGRSLSLSWIQSGESIRDGLRHIGTFRAIGSVPGDGEVVNEGGFSIGRVRQGSLTFNGTTPYSLPIRPAGPLFQ